MPLKNGKGSKIGTNVRGRILTRYHLAREQTIRESLQRLADRARRDLAKLFTRRELRLADSILQQRRRECIAASLKLGSDGNAWDATRGRFRALVSRDLRRALPKAGDWRERVRTYQKDYAKLEGAALRPVLGGTGTLVVGTLPDTHDAQEFSHPYPLHDVSASDFANYPEMQDDSFAVPSIGHLINNLTLAYDDSTSFLNGIFGLYSVIHTWSRAGCGVNYTVPRAGKLRITATLQNFHTRVNMSLEDNFGFSSGHVHAFANGYVEIVRGRTVTTLSQTIVSKSLDSDGDDVSATLPLIDDTTPFTIDVTTEETFPAGAAIQVLAGSEFFSGCTLDDMKATVKALLWSRLNRLTIGVA